MSMEDKIKSAVCKKISQCRVPEHFIPEEIVIKIEYRNTMIVLHIGQDEIIKETKNERMHRNY